MNLFEPGSYRCVLVVVTEGADPLAEQFGKTGEESLPAIQ
jgi:hypothetical protein